MGLSTDAFDEAKARAKAKANAITHLSTGIAVIRDGRVLLVRRVAGDFLGGQYELPGGGVDGAETITAAAERELLEETGLRVTQLIGNFDGFDYSTDTKPRVRQFNFLVEADAGEVKLDPAEHDTYIWADAAMLGSMEMTETMRDCILTALKIPRLTMVLFELPDGQVLLQRRTDDAPYAPGKLGIFGGWMEGDESPGECVRREIVEETSLDVDKLDIGFVASFVVPKSQDFAQDRHFYLFSAKVANRQFDIYEGQGAEAFTVEKLKQRTDLTATADFVFKNII